MKKIGLLSLTLVMVLGALGIGYAHWTDTITIEGTVCTGSVDINVEYLSGSDVYKNLANDDLVYHFWLKDLTGAIIWESWSEMVDPASPDLFLVASAGSTLLGDDLVGMSFTNAFPCSYLTADFIVHYAGSVPAIVTADFTQVPEDPAVAFLWENGYIKVWGQVVYFDDGEFMGFGPIIEGPIQMHYCDYVKVYMTVNLPQDDQLVGTDFTQADFMGKCWDFSALIVATQWNECPLPVG
jgi:hypothetical protein